MVGHGWGLGFPCSTAPWAELFNDSARDSLTEETVGTVSQ